jgi:hypothetical protein
VARPEVLQSLLGSCERVVQEIDSVEYGLTDIQVGLRRPSSVVQGDCTALNHASCRLSCCSFTPHSSMHRAGCFAAGLSVAPHCVCWCCR